MKKAILLVLDDINGLSASENFANRLKSLVDEIATSQTSATLFLPGRPGRSPAIPREASTISGLSL